MATTLPVEPTIPEEASLIHPACAPTSITVSPLRRTCSAQDKMCASVFQRSWSGCDSHQLLPTFFGTGTGNRFRRYLSVLLNEPIWCDGISVPRKDQQQFEIVDGGHEPERNSTIFRKNEAAFICLQRFSKGYLDQAAARTSLRAIGRNRSISTAKTDVWPFCVLYSASIFRFTESSRGESRRIASSFRPSRKRWKTSVPSLVLQYSGNSIWATESTQAASLAKTWHAS